MPKAPEPERELTTIEQIKQRNKDFVVNRQGKDMVLYSGLLDHAHHHGLKSILTAIEQLPTIDNGHLAVVKAIVTLDDGRTFCGIGDASPENVGRMIALHCVRMAETRAKARGLRDAMNVGGAVLEELGPEVEDEPYVAPTSPPRSPLRVVPNLEEQDVAEQTEVPAQRAPRARKSTTPTPNTTADVSPDQGTQATKPEPAQAAIPARPVTRIHQAIWDELREIDQELADPGKTAESYEEIISNALGMMLIGGKNKTEVPAKALQSLSIANTWAASKGVVLPFDGDLGTVDGQGALKVIALLRRAKDVCFPQAPKPTQDPL